MMAEIRELIGKDVEVIANGVSYRGTLIEVSDSEVHLKGVQGFVSLPSSSVGSVRLAEKSVPLWNDTFAVPPEAKKDTIP